MENESPPLPQRQSYAWAWILAAVLLLCACLACCLLIAGAGAAIFWPARSVRTIQLTPSVGRVPIHPAETPGHPTLVPIPTLDLDARPLFGSVSLQRGFTPDPHTVQVTVGGDEAIMTRECGLATPAPTYAFHLSGGASDTFLRIFFVADDDTPTTLLVHTPDGDWLCANSTSAGAPVVDIEFAPSGDYAIWAGTLQEDAIVSDSLSITQDRDVGP